MKRITLFIVIISLSLIINAETVDENGYSVNHPIHGDIESGRPGGPDYSIIPTDPPSSPRMCAEWEPATALLIRYPLGLPWIMLETASEDVFIVCIVSSTYLAQAQTDFSSHSISNIQFIVADNNTFWIRDWGPWCVFDSSGVFGISDHVYNRADTNGREEDDQANWTIADSLSIALWKTELRHTGGNFMTDGHGIGMSGDDIYDFVFNRDISIDSVNAMMNAYWGIGNYITFEDPLTSYIDHIDCYAKFLSEEIIILVENGTSDDITLDALEIYLEGQDNCYGRKYQVYRINAPSIHDAASAHSIILNNRVFVPLTAYADEDSTAIALYESLMPGYEIIGIENPGGTIEFLPTDAIHCRSKALYDTDMLFIDHAPLEDQSSIIDSYTIIANIIPYSGKNLINDSLRIYYRGNAYRDSVWQYSLMYLDSAHWYSGNIPPQPDSTIVNYYITATDNSMKRECDPYPAPLGYYTFNVFNSISMIHFEKYEEDNSKIDNQISIEFLMNSIHIKCLENRNMKYAIYNSMGQHIDCFSSISGPTISINTSHLQNGIYFIQYGTFDSYQREKFLIMK